MTTAATQHGSGPHPSGLDYLTLLERLQDAFHDSIAGVDPGSRVPGCGDWTAGELVEHLSHIHRWAGAQARAQDAHQADAVPGGPAERYAARAAELRETLHDLAPDATARVLAHPEPLGPGPASFWHRRQVHETLVHLHDLRAAAAGSAHLDLVTDVPPEVWADAVDEVVTVFQPRQVGLGRMAPLRVHVLLVAEDSPGASWVLGLPDPDRAQEIVPDVTVTGTARALALLLWRRLTPQEAGVTVNGDRQDLDEALAEPIVP
ncbi:maleylpyruvate isomerase family mycothiol-dependent enzyme [Myceligenerans indicum]|uniref:Maleylpyruvate isomerase family mycothiol-dependent enzyme n=1 Tax=Myceligenerans indicum TaxID=2593663 RepID=A0ABS1LQ21_9MICO|nr:maleylpyruvate isomerase family mycothiol-dependent enzyme [Myceligenerans indicum]MBL0887883.1 maleylpyruvate isomerase family mycothiol-dependent enzyme [Myceligenerans indicum]